MQQNLAQQNKEGETSSPLKQLSDMLQSDMKSVNTLILEHMQSGIPMIPELASHLIAAGGKRVRPLLSIAAANMFDYGGEDHYMLAASVEFIHTATLLHDDVIDDSDQRRGKASAHTIFGNEATVLVGDFLFSRAFQLMVQIGSLDVLRILSDASAVISEGEVLQLTTNNNINISEDDYLKVILSKTAELFSAACEAGAMVSSASEKDSKALRSYGENLGIAFQMIDDLLDYRTADAALGKNTGDDFREGKMTLPVILAVAHADDEEKAFWQRTCGDLDQQDGDFEHACALVEKHNVVAEGLEKARAYGDKAQDALASVNSSSPLAPLLHNLIDFVIERHY